MIKNFFSFLDAQLFWIKSFLSEMQPSGYLKGSSKRLLIAAIIYLFSHSVLKTGASTHWVKIPDIPEAWLWLLGIILGANLLTGVKVNLFKNLLSGDGETKK